VSARRRSPIRRPFWTRPAPLRAEDALPLVLAAGAADAAPPEARLRRGRAAWPLALTPGEPLGPERAAWAGRLVEEAPPGLYDLEVRIGGRRYTERRAVAVLPERVAGLTLAHCSDLHVLKPTAEALEDRTGRILALIERLNALRPDVVVCTGDLISRYDPAKRPLPAKTIRWQIRWVAEHLGEIEAPLYVTIGNHDVAFRGTRKAWYAAMGGAGGERPDDASVDWGPYHLSLLDAFAYYDGRNVLRASAFTADQLAWLRADMAATDPDATRLLFAHYDYHHQLPGILPFLGLDGFFYGHSGPLYPEELERHAVWDGHLPAALALRVVRVVGKAVEVRESVPWRALG
jgi:hypothetical protein